jgi:uncharacterized protein
MNEPELSLASLKPIPAPNPDTAPYWAALREHRLTIQKCTNCGKLRHYPRPMCDACYCMEHVWSDASGHGTVYSWTETHHAFNPGFKAEVPYVLVTVDLIEGVRLNVQLRDASAHVLEIGQAVIVGFEALSPELTVPVVRLA